MDTNRKHRKFDIIVTLNHRNIDKRLISEFIRSGATIFRINTSFLKIEKLEEFTRKLKSFIRGRAKILLDLPGAKIRFSNLDNDLHVEQGIPYKINAASFNHPDFIQVLEIGSKLRVCDGMIKLTVCEKGNDFVSFTASDAVVIKRGKGLHLSDTDCYRPVRAFSDLDDKIIEVAATCEVDYVGLSYVADSADVHYVQEYLGKSKVQCIPKIEAKESLANLHEILCCSDRVIIDRGDLAGEVGIHNVWKYQRYAIAMAHLMNTQAIIATQFFTSMINRPLPTIAEIDSLYSLLEFGADGIQLSDETCVGNYAIETIKILNTCVKEFSGNKPDNTIKKNRVVWIMGPTSSGKTTIAKSLFEKFKRSNIDTAFIDGDEIRDLLGDDLGFSPKDRTLVIKNIVHHAKKHADNGSLVVVAALTANEDDRKYIQRHLDELVVIYLKCSIKECIKRDPKGLYEKALRDEIKTLIGLNNPYLDPDPDMVQLTVDTQQLTEEQCLDLIIRYLTSNNYLDSCVRKSPFVIL